MDTIEGDKFVVDCARFIRYNESKLGDSTSAAGSTSSALYSSLTWINPTTWLMAGVPQPSSSSTGTDHVNKQRTNKTLSASSRPIPAVQHRPMPFRISNHHLYYLLIRCEALGLPVGTLDVKIPKRSRPSSSFAFISNNAAGATIRKRDREETMSISSLQTTMSVFGLGAGSKGVSASSWWSSEKPNVPAELRYIYSAMTKLPALRIGPPPLKLIRDFEDCPGELSIPLDAFKNVQLLEFEDNDPRTCIGWDRLSMQLRSLSMKRSGVEDVQDIIIDAVRRDADRRSGRRETHVKPYSRQAPSDESAAGPSHSTNDSSNDDNVAQLEDRIATELPALAWYFLRHLSLADNSLTFVHAAPISCIANLTSMDLSNNLLNAVPPSLAALKNLRSLNLSNNLIDSVLGIPLSIPSIQALNLSHNRLESLCGLERLSDLARIDLRSNEVFEPGEVGRLATLDHIKEVFIAGNPLMDEEEDPRVKVFVEFAKEGRNMDRLSLDGEPVGYFERQRVREAVPNFERLAKNRSSTNRKHTPFASELGKAADKSRIKKDADDGDKYVDGELSVDTAAADEEEGRTAHMSVIKNVRHRGQHHGAVTRQSTIAASHNADRMAAEENAVKEAKLLSDKRSASPSQPGVHGSRIAVHTQQRRNRRVVELADSFNETHASDTATTSPSHVAEESDSDKIKRAALRGDLDVAIGSSSSSPITTAHAPSAKSATKSTSRDVLGKSTVGDSVGNDEKVGNDVAKGIRASDELYKSKTAGKQRGGAESDDYYRQPMGAQIGASSKSTKVKSEPVAKSSFVDEDGMADRQEDTRSVHGQDLRRKIEALKGEVGDDWMRLLARGESA